MNDPKSFISALFDLTFSSFIIPKILRVIFIVGIVMSGLGALGLAGSMLFSGSVGLMLAGLIVAPLIFFVYVILLRAYCELMLVQFSIRENVERLANHVVGAPGPGGGGPVDGRGVVHSPSPSSSPSPAAAPAAAPTPAAAPAPTPSEPSGGGGGWS